MVEFKRRDALGTGFREEVLNHGLPTGHIGKRPDGEFVYYRGAHNDLTPTCAGRDLEALKRRIKGDP
jgi:hypothetical protein